MCIIIVKPIDKTIIRRRLRNCFTNNSDGAGMMYVDSSGRLMIEKGFFGFRKFYKRFREREAKNPNSPFILHFRIATSGGIRAETCHPFYIYNELGFAHNGIFAMLGSAEQSDTQEFNNNYLKKLPKGFLKMKKAKDAIEEYIVSSGSKAAFLDSSKNITIMNEVMGSWDEDDGCWYSNSTYMHASTYPYGYSNDYLNNIGDYQSSYKRGFKRCIVCGCATASSNVSWEELIFEGVEKNGWVCTFCIDFMSIKYRCSLCNENKKRMDLYMNIYGEFTCGDCLLLDRTAALLVDMKENFNELISIDGRCPVCMQDVTVKAVNNWVCPFCNVKLERVDYIPTN